MLVKNEEIAALPRQAGSLAMTEQASTHSPQGEEFTLI